MDKNTVRLIYYLPSIWRRLNVKKFGNNYKEVWYTIKKRKAFKGSIKFYLFQMPKWAFPGFLIIKVTDICFKKILCSWGLQRFTLAPWGKYMWLRLLEGCTSTTINHPPSAPFNIKSASLTVYQYPFILLGGERHWVRVKSVSPKNN